MDNMSEAEIKALDAVILTASYNGFDFFFPDEVEIDGLSVRQVVGYLSDLSKKGYIERTDEPDGIMEVTPKLMEVAKTQGYAYAQG